jgi:cystathionine beta-lyase/cystathionine gamma-synthase
MPNSSTPGPQRPSSTTCVHAGRRPSEADSGVVTAIDRSSTYLLDEAAYEKIRAGRGHQARIYSRYGNPTVETLERRVAALEGAEVCRAFGSGMAALHAMLLATCARGGPGHVVAASSLYGGTRELLERGWRELGGRVTFVDLGDPVALRAALAEDARALMCESIANPTLELADLPALAALAHQHQALLLVDATFASPVLQRPLDHGADLVMHSASKYLGGHSDVIAGVVSGRAELMDSVEAWRRRAGGVLDPEPAYLLERGVKTLALRMRAHCESARAVAAALAAHPQVSRVTYPGLDGFPQRDLAEQLLTDTGGMIFFVVEGGDEAALAVLDRLRLAIPAASLGGVETLVCTPATTSHAAMSPAERLAIGIPPGAIRISVGIEEAAELIEDFTQALGALA